MDSNWWGDDIEVIQGRMPDGSAPFRTIDSILDLPDDWIAFIGDTHADYEALEYNIGICESLGVKNAIHVGDFGYMLNGHPGQNEYETDGMLADARDDFGFELIVIDGNHDNHALYHRSNPSKALRRVTNNAEFWYAPRGAVLDIPVSSALTYENFEDMSTMTAQDTLKFGFMGGAQSVNLAGKHVFEGERKLWQWKMPTEEDKTLVRDKKWWDDEHPTLDDVESMIDRVGEQGLDVLVSHEAPTQKHLTSQVSVADDLAKELKKTSTYLSKLVQKTKPQLNVHGHWHQFVSSTYKGTQVLSLDKEKTYGNLVFMRKSNLGLVPVNAFLKNKSHQINIFKHKDRY